MTTQLPGRTASGPDRDIRSQSQSGPVRVLIVDDQEAFRSAARLVVEMTDGFETVGEAGDGLAALELAGSLDAQLVLLDMRLPVIDGVEVTRRLSRDHPEIRVLALSTHDEYERRALAAGAVTFVTKAAFGPDAVLEAWRRSGRGRAAQRGRRPEWNDAADGGGSTGS